MTEYELRVATADDFEAANRLVNLAFGEDVRPESIEGLRDRYEPDRSYLIIHNADVVGHTTAFTRDLTVPGAVVPAAHVSGVAVSPLHRRRGLLTRLMAHQLGQPAEPIAVLWASEASIYQRFGYGLACRVLDFEINSREIRLDPRLDPRLDRRLPNGGSLRAVAGEDAVKQLKQVYERVRPDRPGWSSRDDTWWGRILADSESNRRGATSYRIVLFADDGYAIWRTKSNWNHGGPIHEAHVIELVAATPEAYLGLWRFVLSLDLVRTTRFRFAALDEPLQFLVNEPRQLGTRVSDALWVRLVDLPAALAARRYAVGFDTVFEVSDALLPGNAGRWRLHADPSGTATCTSTTDAADIACDVVDLGAAYLGGTPLGTLADGGRVRELRPGTLAPVAAGFGWHRGPSVLDIF